MEDWQTCNGVFDFESSSYAIKNYYNDVLDNGWGPFEDNGNEYLSFHYIFFFLRKSSDEFYCLNSFR